MSRSARSGVKLSVDEYALYDTPDGKAELVRGELRLSPPPGAPHGIVILAIATRLNDYAQAHRLGAVFIDCGFELLELPRTVRSPDVAFVRADRLPPDGVAPGFMRVAPDLVVEVISPSETRARRREKLDDYRASGVSLVWLIDPIARTVTIVEDDGASRRLNQNEVLTGGNVLPGFSCEIATLFVGLR